MVKDGKKNQLGGVPIPGASLSDLMGKQSVRATFRLTVRAIEAISVVACHLGIKQKSLFDHLIEDTGSLSAIAESLSGVTITKIPRVQKTFVLSRRTLNTLEIMSHDFGMPRDVLVEYSIKRLEEVIEAERQKHAIRKKVLVEFGEHVRKGQSLFMKTRELLGDDDPVVMSMNSAQSAAAGAYNNIAGVVEKGKAIEEF